MGFAEDRAKEALKACGGNVERAVETLSANLDSAPEEEPPSSKISLRNRSRFDI